MTALSRVVISQRERTIALRPMGDGLMAHTLYEDRDLNSPKELFDGMAEIKTDPEMVQGIIAGGLPALTSAQEGAEDNLEQAAFERAQKHATIIRIRQHHRADTGVRQKI